MKRSLVAATAVLLAAAGCSAEADPAPEPETTSTAAPTSGAALTGGSRQAETAFDEQLDSWLLECHDLLDGQSTTTHDISWEHSVSLEGNAYRLLGTATPFSTSIEFPIRCEVDSDWNVSIDKVRSAIPRDSGAMMNARYAADFNHDLPLKADDAKVDKCLDLLSAKYGAESVSVVIEFSSVNRTEQGPGHIIDGTSTGEATGEIMEFACSIPDDGEAELIWFLEKR